MEDVLYALGFGLVAAELRAEQSLDDPPDDRRRVAATEQIRGEPRGRTFRRGAFERDQSPTAGVERPVLLGGVIEGRLDRGRDDIMRDALGRELSTQPDAPDAAGLGARFRPPAGERGIIEVATGLEIGDDSCGDIWRRTPMAEAPSELARAPGFPGEEVERDEPRGLGVERGPLSRRPAAARPASHLFDYRLRNGDAA
jgi:hypothetical protein